MRKASSLLSKAPETETTEDNIESKVCYLYFLMIMFIILYLIHFIDRRKSKILFM